MIDYRLEKLAKVLVEYSTGVKEGDNVCISAESAALPFIGAIARAAVKRGGLIKYFVDLPEVDEIILKEGKDEQIACPNYRFGECAKSDVWISAWGSDNVQIFKNVNSDSLRLRRIANTNNRKIYTDRMGSGELRWCGTQFPTNANAQYAGMSLNDYENFVYTAGFLDKEDPVSEWNKLETLQERWVRYLDTKKELHIVTPTTDITIGISGRKWINCCGKENFPDGEIFTSPEEDNINGEITFSYPAIINGHEFENVKLKVKKGRIIYATSDDILSEKELLSYIDTDEGSRYFGEVAIGTNYGITKFTRNILFDEKMGGTIHMAVGAAMTEAGGKNESAIHWDMINDMTNFGQIFADGELFYECGKFIEEIINKFESND